MNVDVSVFLEVVVVRYIEVGGCNGQLGGASSRAWSRMRNYSHVISSSRPMFPAFKISLPSIINGSSLSLSHEDDHRTKQNINKSVETCT